MTKRTKAVRKSNIAAVIKVNGNREITPSKDKPLRYDEVDSTLSLADGGMVIDAETGYSIVLVVTNPKAFPPLAQVQDIADAAAAGIDLSFLLPKSAGSGQALTGDLYFAGHDLINIGQIIDIADKLILDGRVLYDLNGLALIDFQDVTKGLGISNGTVTSFVKATSTSEEDFLLPNKGGAGGTIAMLSDLAAAGITALTGDGTASGSGSVVFTLATVNSNVGTFNSVTVNAKGQVTAASLIAYLTTISGIAAGGDLDGNYPNPTLKAFGTYTAAAGTVGTTDTPKTAIQKLDGNIALKQNSLGYTAENSANKDTDGTLAANSDVKYASQKATKTYADTKLAKTNSAVAITDASTMDIANVKNTLTTSSATRTFTKSAPDDIVMLWITLNATTAAWTFPTGAKCVSEGISAGNNVLTVAGASGNVYYIEVINNGTFDTVLCKNISA